MTKGRRAADRRRERQGKGPVDDGTGTNPSGRVVEGPGDLADVGDLGDDEDGQGIDPLESAEESLVADDDLPLVSQVREIEPTKVRDPGGPRKPAPGSEPSLGDNDPEASFVKAMRQSSSERRGTGDVTAVKPVPDRPERPHKRGGHVLVLEGPDQGGEADIEVFPTLIGRAASAEIGLTDSAVSLRHIELRYGDRGFSIIDLGSTSGTLVNGTPIAGETALRHGDVFAIGKTEIRFLRADKLPTPRPAPVVVDDHPPIEPTEKLPTRERTAAGTGTGLRRGNTTVKRAAPAPEPRIDPAIGRIVRAKIRRTTTRVIAACGALLLVVALGKLVHDRFFTDSAPAQIRAQVAELLADGRNRLRAQDVDGARAAAQTVLALDDKNDEAKSLLRMADSEGEAGAAVALALRLGDEERDVEAAQILKRIPDASVFAPTRDRLKRTLDERGRLRSRRVTEALLDQGRVVEALDNATKHMATWPDDEEGKLLLERAKAAQLVAPRFPGLAAARAAFASGDVDGARRIARDNGLKGYEKDLDAFQGALARGRSQLSHFDDDAADSLDVAFRLLGALGGEVTSPMFAEVRKPYAKALLVAGTAKLDSSPCAAARQLYRAARVTPEDGAVQSKLRELDDRAQAALDRARAAKHSDADRAAAIAREGVCLARTGSKTYDELRALSRL